MKTISFEKHPTNVRVFTAPNIVQALRQAEKALRKNGVQAAVWLKRDNRSDFHHPSHYVANFDELPEFGIKGYWFGYQDNVPHCRGNSSDEIVADNIREAGFKDLANLMSTFNQNAGCSLRFNKEDKIRPHYDTAGRGTLFPAYFKPFKGNPIRIFETLYGPGTVVYEKPKSAILKAIWNSSIEYSFDNVFRPNRQEMSVEEACSSLSEPWQVQTGDVLFLTPAAWGSRKALLHSTPEYYVPTWAEARMTRVIDLR